MKEEQKKKPKKASNGVYSQDKKSGIKADGSIYSAGFNS